MSDWKTYKLSELVEIKYGKDHKHMVDGDIPVYGSGGIMRYAETHLYDKESILIPRKGTLSNLFYLDKPFWSVDTMFYTKIKNGVHGKYLYYLLKSMDLASMNVGSAVPSLTTEVLNKVEISLPDLPTQRQIAQILTSLDDKIELNLQMNQTLEAMAQAIFKEWFVNFNFPGFDGELVDGLPKGWRMGKLGDISKVIDCLHSKKPERIGEKTGNILLQLNNIIDNGLLDISEIFWISDDDYKKWISRIEISQGDCVITNVGRVGAAARIPLGIKAAIGRNMTGIRLKEEYPYPGFLITLMKSDLIKMEIEQKKDIGTILEALNVKNIPNLSFPIPTHHIFKEFETIVSKIWDKMEDNTAQNLSLTQTRDILLPKLMSGQLAVV